MPHIWCSGFGPVCCLCLGVRRDKRKLVRSHAVEGVRVRVFSLQTHQSQLNVGRLELLWKDYKLKSVEWRERKCKGTSNGLCMEENQIGINDSTERKTACLLMASTFFLHTFCSGRLVGSPRFVSALIFFCCKWKIGCEWAIYVVPKCNLDLKWLW